jgi:hypothetical protein
MTRTPVRYSREPELADSREGISTKGQHRTGFRYPPAIPIS